MKKITLSLIIIIFCSIAITIPVFAETVKEDKVWNFDSKDPDMVDKYVINGGSIGGAVGGLVGGLAGGAIGGLIAGPIGIKIGQVVGGMVCGFVGGRLGEWIDNLVGPKFNSADVTKKGMGDGPLDPMGKWESRGYFIDRNIESLGSITGGLTRLVAVGMYGLNPFAGFFIDLVGGYAGDFIDMCTSLGNLFKRFDKKEIKENNKIVIQKAETSVVTTDSAMIRRSETIINNNELAKAQAEMKNAYYKYLQVKSETKITPAMKRNYKAYQEAHKKYEAIKQKALVK